jgi:hypothetical protein
MLVGQREQMAALNGAPIFFTSICNLPRILAVHLSDLTHYNLTYTVSAPWERKIYEVFFLNWLWKRSLISVYMRLKTAPFDTVQMTSYYEWSCSFKLILSNYRIL